MVARVQLRRRWAPTVSLIVLVGLAGGVVLAAIAGASRTSTAMKRFVTYSRPEEVYVTINGPLGDPSQPSVIAKIVADRARMLALPQVAEAGRAPYLVLAPDKAGNEVGSINPFGAADPDVFRTFDRPIVIQGRLARLDRSDEVTVDDGTARRRHLTVGSPLTMWSYSPEQMNNLFAQGFSKIPAPAGPAYTFRVVGLVRQPSDVNAPPASIVKDALYAGQGGMTLTPAFLRRFADDQKLPEEALPGIEGFRVRLRHGLADLPAFRQGLQGLARPDDIHLGSDIQAAAEKSGRAIHLEALALLVFAGVGAMASLVVVGQVLARRVMADTTDNPTLVALGLSRRQLVLVPLVRAGIVALAGAAAAVVVAVALSPLTPIGLARRAEIHPGWDANVAVLGVGFLGVAGITLLRALVSAWRAASPRRVRGQVPARPGLLTTAVARSGLGPSAVAGVGMSLERGRGIAFRTALVAALVAVTGVVAALTFGVSLDHLVGTPAQQGWNWDVVVGNPNTHAYEGDPSADPLHKHMVELLAGNRYVNSFSGIALGEGTTVDGRPVGIAGVEMVKGSVFQRIVEGRAPVSDGEIALGRDPLRRLHRRVGQIVTVGAGDRRVAMRIVGVSLSPTAGDLSTRLSDHGAVTIAALRRLIPDVPVLVFSVRYRNGVDAEAATQSLVRDFGRQVLRPYPGGEVGDLAKVDYLPEVLAILLVVLALAALGLTLLASVRRHRRDLAVLKAVGFVRRQVAATVAWQATALAIGALVVGVPAGIAIGRATWRLVADGLGSASPPIVPALAIVVILPATVLVANLLAGGPGWSAGRVRPAEALRAE